VFAWRAPALGSGRRPHRQTPLPGPRRTKGGPGNPVRPRVLV